LTSQKSCHHKVHGVITNLLTHNPPDASSGNRERSDSSDKGSLCCRKLEGRATPDLQNTPSSERQMRTRIAIRRPTKACCEDENAIMRRQPTAQDVTRAFADLRVT